MPKPAYRLDTNIVSDLVRRPAGRIRDGMAACGGEQVCTSIMVAVEPSLRGVSRTCAAK